MTDPRPAFDLDNHALVFFDGVCNLCNGAVNFIIDHDPEGYFRFAPLQSEIATTYLDDFTDPDQGLDTIVLLEEGHTYVRSTAALRIARRLTAPWPLFSLALLVPRCLRDPVYDWIAKNRYDWFGQRDQCRMPTPEVRERFLDYEPPGA
jgi:predicted DCC family thiol-disulfide oxidoreductase YuxK